MWAYNLSYNNYVRVSNTLTFKYVITYKLFKGLFMSFAGPI